MASYKEILKEKMDQFRAVQQEEREALEGVENLWLHGKVLEDARAQIKANFADKRRELREDPTYKAALVQNFSSNLFHLDENEWMREEWGKTEWIEEPKPEKEEHTGICPVCGRMDHEPDANFCHGCGNKISMNESNQEREDKEPKKVSRKTKSKKDEEPKKTIRKRKEDKEPKKVSRKRKNKEENDL